MIPFVLRGTWGIFFAGYIGCWSIVGYGTINHTIDVEVTQSSVQIIYAGVTGTPFKKLFPSILTPHHLPNHLLRLSTKILTHGFTDFSNRFQTTSYH